MSKLTLSSWKLAFRDAFLGAASRLPAWSVVICESFHAAAADCQPKLSPFLVLITFPCRFAARAFFCSLPCFLLSGFCVILLLLPGNLTLSQFLSVFFQSQLSFLSDDA